MKSNARIILIYPIFLISLFLISNSYLTTETNFNKSNYLNSSTLLGKVNIDGNSDWIDFKSDGNCTGEGTSADPYIIKDLEIDGQGTGSCIYIRNSDVYFRIENCIVYNAGTNIEDGMIRLNNVQNGLIIGNIVYNARNGITIDNCSEISVTKNHCNNCAGVQIYYSNNIHVYLNNLICGDWGADFIFYAANVSWNTIQPVYYKYKGQTFESYLGNYYSSHDEVDNNNDGICDGPVVVDPHKPTPIIVDKYPLKVFFQNYELTEAPFIPGYSLFILLEVISIVTMSMTITIKKKFKKRK